MDNKTPITLINDFTEWKEIERSLGIILSLQIAVELAAGDMEEVDIISAMNGIRHLVHYTLSEHEKLGKVEVRHA
ncbi:hypothetical protein OXA54_20060 [Klebsiella pneumoniae]|uniref:hypothetical protein n=1 Tax=Klebsiella pneumoniae TaxID=573 RepID=UPI0022751FAA|nr:hypothetical protein [Klebsiella pneumoniae]HDE1546811.1 hypothetical protein [Klebsiella quasipneumoniae]HBT0193453.1 hypothetical protein [Klebsiella pneumoniae]HBY9641926.1 hypothetical protein [Klebsiella pneumoniae]HCD5021501.1 hypothetical protein [Klebsiella pneumoniae]